MRVPGKQIVPSAARPLSALEAAQLASVARELPDGWILQIEAPYGQVAITPRDEAPYHVRCWVSDPALQRTYRRRWMH